MINSFDGERTWGERVGMDPNGLAGDFDGDGAVDIGRGSKITMIGGSPEASWQRYSVALILQWTRLHRSPAEAAWYTITVHAGRRPRGSHFAVMAPIFTGTLEKMVAKVETIVPDLNSDEIRLATSMT